MALALVEVKDGAVTPLAMYERAAAKALGMGINEFRALVKDGTIPYTTHVNRSRRLYLTSDLLAYLESRPRARMTPGKSPISVFKGGKHER